MKKIALAFVVIIGFISYSYYSKVNESVPTAIIVGQSKVNKNNTILSPAQSSTISTQTPTAMVQNKTGSSNANSPYNDGSYVGSVADAVYGNIQVKVTISSGKITNIAFLQYPNDQDTSLQINQQADPILSQEAIQKQSAQVDIVSGATQSSQAFIQSMQTALEKAKI